MDNIYYAANDGGNPNNFDKQGQTNPQNPAQAPGQNPDKRQSPPAEQDFNDKSKQTQPGIDKQTDPSTRPGTGTKPMGEQAETWKKP